MDPGTLFSGPGGWAIGVGTAVLYALGAVMALDAVMKTRTPQGATAWVFALLALPLAAVPLYLVFGRSQFDDYVRAVRDLDARIAAGLEELGDGPLAPFLVPTDGAGGDRGAGELHAFAELATLPFTHGNGARLLVDGEETFEALFAAIDAAEDYVLAQFYIIHDDRIGRAFADRLAAAARRGVAVRLLYDAVGSWRLPRSYRRRLEAAGVSVAAFSGPRSWLKKLRLNFRNHRKITVVDGRVAFTGGLNAGDEYLGRDPDMGPWRDTHVAVTGPVVQGLQLPFVRDWFYATRERVEGLRWEPTAGDEDLRALVLASGPVDEVETCGLLYTHAIESAEERVWIATPYFVPDGRVLGALQLAALRGVDVRILMPRESDSVLFKYVPYAYLDDVARAGGQVLLYEEGFMHQKVTLVDRDYGIVSTANLDNRSFRFNFEATVVVQDGPFCDRVGAMLEADFARATRLRLADLEGRPFAFRFAVNATRLLAPVL
jgi:cardiolipin synthase